VGAIHNYLTMIMTHPALKRMKDEIWDITGRLPSGELIQKAVGRIDTGLKSIVTPGALFEGMGFRYLGPANGHNLESMLKILRQVKEHDGPIMLHVITQKGRGYKFAEEDATQFHGLDAFDKDTGTVNGSGREIRSYTSVFGKAMVELAENDDRIVGITAAMAEGTGLNLMRDKFPDRVYDVGIAEGHAVTFAAGLASQGMRPVAAIYSTFLQRALDQVIHDVAIQKLPVIFAIDRGGVVGEDGPTHHGCFDISYLRQIPNMAIMVPRDEAELRDMLYTATRYSGGPVAIRYPRGAGVGVPTDEGFREIAWGKGEILREGREIAILGVGPALYECMKVAEILAEEDFNPTITDMKFVKPFDVGLLKETAGSHRTIVTVEENAIEGGFGSRVLEFVSALDYHNRVLRLGIPDRFIEHGPRKHLLKNLGLTAEGIVDSVRKFVGSEKLVH